jgi:hypothetical protein
MPLRIDLAPDEYDASSFQRIFRKLELWAVGVENMQRRNIVIDPSKKLILRDAATPPHFWEITVSTTGTLTTTDLGTAI